VLFPYLVPAVVASLVWRFMFNPLTGVVNYLLIDVLHILKVPIAWLADPKTALIAVIIVGIWKFVPFMIILFLARLQTTPLDLYDAAKVDGATAWQEFRYITLPWLRPTIIVALLLRTLWLFNNFDLVYLMAYGGPLRSATTVPVLIRTTAFDFMEMGKAASISMCMVIILFFMSGFYSRFYGRAEEELRY
jgi:multiple sugar transport system permease protein